MIVEQGIGDEADIVEVGEKLKQGIAGLGDEDLRAGIAMEAEEVAVASLVLVVRKICVGATCAEAASA